MLHKFKCRELCLSLSIYKTICDLLIHQSLPVHGMSMAFPQGNNLSIVTLHLFTFQAVPTLAMLKQDSV